MSPVACRWWPLIDATSWLQYLSSLLRAAAETVQAMCDGRPVLVHCSDGWDRTTQIVTLAKLLMDPFYRTIRVGEGFAFLGWRVPVLIRVCGWWIGRRYPCPSMANRRMDDGCDIMLYETLFSPLCPHLVCVVIVGSFLLLSCFDVSL